MSTRPRGAMPGWQPRSVRQKAILADLIARYQQHYDEDTLPRGGRGIFYDLRPNGMGNGVTYLKPSDAFPIKAFAPMMAHPAAVQEVLLLARRAGIIPEDWVADSRAPEAIGFSSYSSGAEFADVVRRSAANFRLDPQRGQRRYIEFWSEAQDLSPRVARISLPYGVKVYSGGGYDGLKPKRDVAARAAARDVPTIVLHIGDFDKHGGQIFTAITEDASAWVADDYGLSSDWLRFRRLAITHDQAEQYGVLDADGKAEADALPVPAMDAIIREALDELIDAEVRDVVLEDQAHERRQLGDLIREALA
jgi:hypothetical protein